MKRIFYGDNDGRDCLNTKRYAYLNWWFDDGCGRNGCEYQHIFDNYNMGQAFMGNALLTLSSIIESNNFTNVADKLIFPALFSVWHGLELWLKSSISALEFLAGDKVNNKVSHDIFRLAADLEQILKDHGCEDIILNAMPNLKHIIEELKRVDAHHDFARYSFDVRGNYQFYNAPYVSDKQWQHNEKDPFVHNVVPNTCVDIYNLYEVLMEIFNEFGSFVEYLTLCVSEGEKNPYYNYSKYLENVQKCSEMFNQSELNIMSTSEMIFNKIMD